jgi:hypothetical protein
MLKELIKRLSAEQKPLKQARKTGTCTYDRAYRVPEDIAKCHQAANKVQANRVRITAALNLYHEFRHSEYRHGVDESDKYLYARYFKEISELITAELAKANFVA